MKRQTDTAEKERFCFWKLYWLLDSYVKTQTAGGNLHQFWGEVGYARREEISYKVRPVISC